MKILFVTTEIPSPRGGGGPIANYYHLRGLIEAGHRVVLVSLVPREDEVPVEGLRKAVLVPRVRPSTGSRLLANLFQKEPVPIRKYMDAAAGPEIQTLQMTHAFDFVHLASLHTAHLLDPLRGVSNVPVVLYEHNVQSTIHELFFRMQRHPLRRWYAHLQWKKMRVYEEETCRRFDRVLTFSKSDADTLSELSKGSTVSWLPLAVDARGLSEISRPEAYDLLWIGSLRWAPNLDSLHWFTEEILPRVLRERPETTVAVAGSSPPPWLGSLAARRPGVRVLGEVEDAHDLMARSRIVVVPLRIGSGVRVKILEALSLGRAVVTTTLGYEGIEAEPGEHLAVGDDPDGFARQTVRLLENPDLRSELGGRGRELVLARHDYREVGARMSALYEKMR